MLESSKNGGGTRGPVTVWLDQEPALRAELPAAVADSLVGEANTLPMLDEEVRPWLLIAAIAA
jgi:hypothetical protein